MAYIGDGNNMAHSLMIGAAKVGMDISIASPNGYKPNEEVVKWQKNLLKKAALKLLSRKIQLKQ